VAPPRHATSRLAATPEPTGSEFTVVTMGLVLVARAAAAVSGCGGNDQLDLELHQLGG
jgi:hypothetical protein